MDLPDIRSFGPWEIADLIILALVLWRVYLYFRRFRALSLVKGLLVVFVATAVARLLHLQIIGWLLDRLTTGILVALPIIFYPELRRVLEELGSGQSFLGLRRGMPAMARSADTDAATAQAIEAVVAAVAELSQKRVGALIAFEGATGLQDYTTAGTALDALPSRELLLNLFMPGSPLHDGAVMIREGRIVAARCVLPLAEPRPALAGLGTRHRAAVGLAEATDAAVVVVSEETGIVSLAHGEDLIRPLRPGELRSRLRSLLLSAGTGRGWWPFGRAQSRAQGAAAGGAGDHPYAPQRGAQAGRDLHCQ